MAKDSNLYGAVAYVLSLITGVLMLVIEPKDKYVKFHAMQSIILGVVYGAVWIVLSILFGILAIATLGMGILLLAPLMMLLWLVFIVLSVYLMYKAYNGEKYKLPLIGDYAEKLAKN